jgi:splicing factor 3A subunit 3
MLVEEQRYIHEDLERLEQGIADRISDDPTQVRRHNIAALVTSLY